MSKENLTGYQHRTLELIMERKKAAPITGKEIANQIGLKPRKSGKEGADLRSIINALRVKGYPVCASGSGYWWPQSQEEFSAYIMSFDSRIADQLKAAEGMKKGWDLIGGAGKAHLARNTTSIWSVDGKIFQVRGDQVYVFKQRYPQAIKVQ